MTSPTAHSTVRSTARLTHPIWLTLRFLIASHQGAFVWTWLSFIIAIALVGFGIAAWGTLEVSVWHGASAIPQWAMLGLAISLPAEHLPVFVGHGVSRRHFYTGVMGFFVALALASAGVMVLGYGLEHLVYTTFGLPHVLGNAYHFTSAGEVGRIIVQFTLLFIALLVSGLLIGLGFYRYGAWRGLPTLLTASTLALATSALMQSGWVGLPVFDPVAVTLPVAATASLLLSGLAALIGYVLVRDVAIRLK